VALVFGMTIVKVKSDDFTVPLIEEGN